MPLALGQTDQLSHGLPGSCAGAQGAGHPEKFAHLSCGGGGSTAGAAPSASALCLADKLTGCSPCCFFQLMSAIQKGHVSGSRLAVLMKTAEENLGQRVVIPVDRSGGGL